jgi:transposase InsO family protein
MARPKLVYLLRAKGILRSESMVGRILSSLTARRLLIEPHAVRVPKAKRQPTAPGALAQLDTMPLRPEPGVERRQFTAIDVVSRCAVVGVRASARTARDFLNELITRMPVPIQAIPGDGGSEFMGAFEAACQARGIALYVLPPRVPKLNGRVERLNGTARREF